MQKLTLSFSFLFLALPLLCSGQSVSCDPPYILIGDICYYIIPTPVTTSWVDSRNACFRLGGTLAILDTQGKDEAVRGYLRDNPGLVPFFVWIGLNSQETPGTWIWDGTGEEATYTNFANNPPTTNCMSSNGSKWFDFPCWYTEDFQYICEKVNFTCEDPFIPLSGRCYYFHTSSNSTWTAAHNFCNRIDSHLVAIDSEAENHAVAAHLTSNFAGEPFWLGGYKDESDDNWYWDNTGYPMSYFEWKSGHPGNSSDEACMAADENGWYDEDCRESNWFVCEKKR